MNYKKWAAFFYVHFILLCQHSLVLARAGGGHSSRSSSSGHSSSGGPSSWGGSTYHSTGASYSPYSSPSSADFGFGSIFLIVVILIVIVVILTFVLRSRSDEVDEDSSCWKSQGEAPDVILPPDLATRIAQLKTRDPGFNEQVFQDKISTAFFTIENAWCARDMNPARLFLSDAVYSRFQLQLEEYLRNHTFNRLDELCLDKASIVNIRSDGNYDTIDVWITATAKDYVVDEKGNVVSGSTDLKTWDEKWSLMRSAKATTQIKQGVSSAKCPNCGSPVEINAAGECSYCHSKINRYDFDWVLSEIEQLNIG